MPHPVWATSLGSEFDNFLSAPVREDGNGMLLSVISALARLDLDPWQEATSLSGLSQEAATQRLASLIAALPETRSANRDPRAIASRLIALLPHPSHSPGASPKISLDAVATPHRRALMYVFLVVFVLGIQWMVASRQAPAPLDAAPAPASSLVAPQVAPSDTDR